MLKYFLGLFEEGFQQILVKVCVECLRFGFWFWLWFGLRFGLWFGRQISFSRVPGFFRNLCWRVRVCCFEFAFELVFELRFRLGANVGRSCGVVELDCFVGGQLFGYLATGFFLVAADICPGKVVGGVGLLIRCLGLVQTRCGFGFGFGPEIDCLDIVLEIRSRLSEFMLAGLIGRHGVGFVFPEIFGWCAGGGIH
jgi:hypothetical protein